MIVLLGATVVVLLVLLGLRQALHKAAKARAWRIGPWSKLLPGWGEQACLRCGTSYAYAKPHGTPVALGGGHVPGYVMPLCNVCWTELGTPSKRIPFYEELFRQWARDGAHRTVEDLHAVRAAVATGL